MIFFKLNGFQKFACLVLIVVLVVTTICFAVDGWQIDSIFNDALSENNNAGSDDKTDSSDDTTLDNGENDPLPEEAPEAPIYLNAATGLQISETEYNLSPLGIIFDPSAPIYGMANADISIEIPVEFGETRMLGYITSKDLLWKIGSLKPTRKYISNISNYFGGKIVSYGNDGKIEYDSQDTSEYEIDISKYSDCFYIENSSHVYTSNQMLDTVLNNLDEPYQSEKYKDMPYVFASSSTATGRSDAEVITIPYSDSNKTQLYYDDANEKYLYYKSGSKKLDMLSGNHIAFSNVFILFSNAVTYESINGSEIVVDTFSGGKGYYITKGNLTEFNWSIDENGNLKFKDSKGQLLAVDRGNSYISFFKASSVSKIMFS